LASAPDPRVIAFGYLISGSLAQPAMKKKVEAQISKIVKELNKQKNERMATIIEDTIRSFTHRIMNYLLTGA
jgi:hypothetical protein